MLNEYREPTLIRSYAHGSDYEVDAARLYLEGWLIRERIVHHRRFRLARWLTRGLIDRVIVPGPRMTVTYVRVGSIQRPRAGPAPPVVEPEPRDLPVRSDEGWVSDDDLPALY